MPTTNSPSLDQLRRATQLAEQIEQLQSELTSLLSGGGQQQQGSSSSQSSASASSTTRTSQGTQGGKRIISPEARAKMAAAQKARWAKVNGAKAPSSNGGATESKAQSKSAGGQQKSNDGKRVMSPEAREKIAAAQRARWAKAKKQGGK